MLIEPGKLLRNINSPDDLKKLDQAQLVKVCDELRQYIIDIVSVLQNDSGTAANLLDVLTEAERRDIPRSKAEDIIDKLCRDGRMMRPSGYDTLQIV